MRDPIVIVGLASLLVGCAPDWERVELTQAPVELTLRPRVFRSDDGGFFPAHLESQRLCLQTPTGYTDDFPVLGAAFRAPSGDRVLIGANAYLENGERLALATSGLHGSGLCLTPGPQHPRPPVREILIWASAPITIPRIWWETNDPK
jgi:hypothetical protein